MFSVVTYKKYMQTRDAHALNYVEVNILCA